MANRMEQIVKKIGYRENEIRVSFNLAFLNIDEVARKKKLLERAFSLDTI